MKRFPMVLTLVALTGAGFALLANADKGGIQGGNRGDNQVAICHYAGHQGDFVIESNGCGCKAEQGGQILIVGRAACEEGHKAHKGGPTGSGDNTCASDNIAGLDPEACD